MFTDVGRRLKAAEILLCPPEDCTNILMIWHTAVPARYSEDPLF